MSSKKHKIAIIIPAYNEATVIDGVLKKLILDLNKDDATSNSTIVVVNDGSKDDTAKIVSRHKDVVLISHLLNSGAGAATRTALRYARTNGFEFAISCDADGQHASEDVISVAKELSKEKFDMIIGSRLFAEEGMIWYRKLGNLGLSLFTFLLFGSTVKDSQSGLRGYGKKALQNITWHSNNFTFNSELMWRARQLKLTIKEIPIKAIYTDYSLAKGQSNWNAIPIFRQLLKRRLMEFLGE